MASRENPKNSEVGILKGQFAVLFVDAGEVDDGAEVGGGDELVVDPSQEADDVIFIAEFGVFALDVAGGEFTDGLNVNAVDDGTV